MGNSEPVKDLPDKIEFMNCSVVSRMNQHPRIPSSTTGRMPYLFGIRRFAFSGVVRAGTSPSNRQTSGKGRRFNPGKRSLRGTFRERLTKNNETRMPCRKNPAGTPHGYQGQNQRLHALSRHLAGVLKNYNFFAGFPKTVAPSPTFSTTTEPAPMRAPAPT